MAYHTLKERSQPSPLTAGELDTETPPDKSSDPQGFAPWGGCGNKFTL